MSLIVVRQVLLSSLLAALFSPLVHGAAIPLPASDGEVTLPAQEWPHQPGKRTIAVQIHYPGGQLAKVDRDTGVMLTLHNWGGTKASGTADPQMLAERYNVVAISLDYLQSGPHDPAVAPYDYGYLQALDALRAVYYVIFSLDARKIAFDRGRIYAAGGSGGGNVALMCNKLAPRTFACVVDLSGMTKLNDDIAFNLPGGSELDAGYSREAGSKFLSPDAQDIRFIGQPAHLAVMKQLGSAAKVIVVHGVDDGLCPVADAEELIHNMQQAKLDVEPHLISQTHVDGKLFTDSGHGLGNRGQIVCHVADPYLLPKSPKKLRRAGKSDFELRDEQVRYPTPGGQFVISYERGYPIGRFEPAAAASKSTAP